MADTLCVLLVPLAVVLSTEFVSASFVETPFVCVFPLSLAEIGSVHERILHAKFVVIYPSKTERKRTVRLAV